MSCDVCHESEAPFRFVYLARRATLKLDLCRKCAQERGLGEARDLLERWPFAQRIVLYCQPREEIEEKPALPPHLVAKMVERRRLHADPPRCHACNQGTASVTVSQVVDGQSRRLTLCDGCANHRGITLGDQHLPITVVGDASGPASLRIREIPVGFWKSHQDEDYCNRCRKANPVVCVTKTVSPNLLRLRLCADCAGEMQINLAKTSLPYDNIEQVCADPSLSQARKVSGPKLSAFFSTTSRKGRRRSRACVTHVGARLRQCFLLSSSRVAS